MKKATIFTIVVCSLCILFSSSIQAQEVNGKNFINAGIGLGAFNMLGTGGLPLSVSIEHGFHEYISAGVYVGYIQRRFATDWKYTYTVIGARGSYHANELLKLENPKVDLYGGATLYYRRYSYKYTETSQTYTNSSGGSAGIAFHVGGRYMFTDNIGGFAEVGYGISPLLLGLTIKI
jgi:hypothetical protein